MSTPSKEALFRYQVVSQVRSRMLTGTSKRDAVAQTCAAPHASLDGGRRRVTPRTLYRWLAAFDRLGAGGLEPAARRRKKPSPQALPPRFLDFLQTEKTDDPRASIPELIRRGHELGLIPKDATIDRTTVYRWLLRSGIPVARRKSAKQRDARRFAHPHRMMMVLCDGKHFRAGVQRAKRLAMFFLDDASRFGLHVVVGTSESGALFLRGLYETIRRFGLMSILYLDHGSGFIADDTVAVAKNLGIALIHGEVAYPEGHGKIERFHRTADAQILRGLDGRPDVDPDCGALEIRLQHFLAEVYDRHPHQSLGRESPQDRFFADRRALVFPESDTELRRLFVVYEERRVSPDRVVTVCGKAYEMPRGYSGQKVLLHRGVLDGSLRFLHDGRLMELRPVDLGANAASGRARGPAPDQESPRSLSKSAADLAFDRDFHPVVSKDGGLLRPFEESSP